MANWSDLPDHIVDLSVKHLPPYAEDFSRFSAVCKPWRSVALDRKQTRFGPWLMLPDNTNNSDEDGIVSFYSVSSRQLFHLRLPPSRGKRCWGSPYGWLVTVGPDLRIHILNPLTASQLSLPSLHNFPLQNPNEEPFYVCSPEHGFTLCLQRMVLSSNPSCRATPPNRASPEQCCLAINEDFQLAFAFPGDETWTTIDTGDDPANVDVLLYRGHIYVVELGGKLLICKEINTEHPKATCIVEPPEIGERWKTTRENKFYLVEMSGDLNMVVRYEESGGLFSPLNFEVYRCDFRNMMWTPVPGFRQHALFVGNNVSFALSSSDYPEIKGNSIYFTDDRFHCYKSKSACYMGVFHYAKKTIEPFYSGNGTISEFSRPLFFMPSM